MKQPRYKRPWKLRPEEIERLNSRCVEVGTCLEWQGATTGDGRPVMQIKRYAKWITVNLRPTLARRQGLEVSLTRRTVMTCGNGICLNTDHMACQATKAIVRSAARTGPDAWRQPTRRARLAEAARQRWGKLTDEAIADMRTKAEKQTVYMARYGISKTTVSEIWNGKSHAPELQAGNVWGGLFSGLMGGRAA